MSVVSKWVSRRSRFLVLSPGWPCTQTDASLNWYFSSFLEEHNFEQTTSNIDISYIKSNISEIPIDTYQFQVLMTTVERETTNGSHMFHGVHLRPFFRWVSGHHPLDQLHQRLGRPTSPFTHSKDHGRWLGSWGVQCGLSGPRAAQLAAVASSGLAGLGLKVLGPSKSFSGLRVTKGAHRHPPLPWPFVNTRGRKREPWTGRAKVGEREPSRVGEGWGGR